MPVTVELYKNNECVYTFEMSHMRLTTLDVTSHKPNVSSLIDHINACIIENQSLINKKVEFIQLVREHGFDDEIDIKEKINELNHLQNCNEIYKAFVAEHLAPYADCTFELFF